jgi:hypothetical protein
MPRPNPAYSALDSRRPQYFDQPLYDTVAYPILGAATLNFFTIPLGQPAVIRTPLGGAPVAGVQWPKTYRDTNMRVAGIIPGEEMYEFSGFNIVFRRAVLPATPELITDLADRQHIMNNGWFNIRIGMKDVFYIPSDLVPAFNPLVATSWAGQGLQNNGMRAPMYSFRTPIYVQGGQTINVTLNYPGNVVVTTSVDLLLTLYAQMERPS